MKNHLSIEASILAGTRFSLAGRGGSCSGLTRLGEWPTVRLVLLRRLALGGCSVDCSGRGRPNLRRNVTGLSLAGDELLPSLGALVDDVHGVPFPAVGFRGETDYINPTPEYLLLVLALAGESKLVLRACRQGFCKYGTTRWWRGGDQAGGAQRPRHR